MEVKVLYHKQPKHMRTEHYPGYIGRKDKTASWEDEHWTVIFSAGDKGRSKKRLIYCIMLFFVLGSTASASALLALTCAPIFLIIVDPSLYILSFAGEPGAGLKVA